MRHQEIQEVTEMFYIFIVLVVIQMQTFVKTHWTIHLKIIFFILYELYHNIFDLKKAIWLIFYVWSSISIDLLYQGNMVWKQEDNQYNLCQSYTSLGFGFFCCKQRFITISQICSQEIFRMLQIFWEKALHYQIIQ